MLLCLSIIQFNLWLHLIIFLLWLGHFFVKIGFKVTHYLLIYWFFLLSLWHHRWVSGWFVSLLWTLENVWLRTFFRDHVDAIVVLLLAVARMWTCQLRYWARLLQLFDLLLLLCVHFFELSDFVLDTWIIHRRWRVGSASAVVRSICSMIVLFIIKVLSAVLKNPIWWANIVLLIFILVLVGISEIYICYLLAGFDVLQCSCSKSLVVFIIETIPSCYEQVCIVISNTDWWMLCSLFF